MLLATADWNTSTKKANDAALTQIITNQQIHCKGWNGQDQPFRRLVLMTDPPIGLSPSSVQSGQNRSR